MGGNVAVVNESVNRESKQGSAAESSNPILDDSDPESLVEAGASTVCAVHRRAHS